MKFKVIKKEWILIIVFGLFTGTILFLSVRGLSGNPNVDDLNTSQWRAGGPLELSPERGRFALTYSIVEDGSLQFSLPLARFVTPDLAINPKGEYVSLFAPGVSFLAIPGYIFGRYFGVAQVGAFATSAFFAFLNFFMILAITKRFGSSMAAGLLAGMVFVFATPAFSYATTLYQHHISTFVLLLSIYTLIRWNGFWSLMLIWSLCATSVLIDNPNFFLMLPIGIGALGKIVWTELTRKGLVVQMRPWRMVSFLGMIFPILFFLWFNQSSHGDPLKLSGTLPSVDAIDAEGNPTKSEVEKSLNLKEDGVQHEKTAVNFFETRNLLSGFYIHFLSLDRGIISFTPVMFLGIWGLALVYHQHKKWGALLIAVALTNVLLYSMWGDPWGGWAFGSRYLIPSYALFSVGVGVLLSQIKRSLLPFLLFLVLFSYSVAVNTLGALTSNANPPQIQVLEMEKLSGYEEKYTFMRNWQFLKANGPKSFIYKTWAYEQISPVEYYINIVLIIIAGGCILLLISISHLPELIYNPKNKKI